MNRSFQATLLLGAVFLGGCAVHETHTVRSTASVGYSTYDTVPHVHTSRVYVTPAPVYVTPPPPVYVVPAPVYSSPAPIYVSPPVYAHPNPSVSLTIQSGSHHHRHGHSGHGYRHEPRHGHGHAHGPYLRSAPPAGNAANSRIGGPGWTGSVWGR